VLCPACNTVSAPPHPAYSGRGRFIGGGKMILLSFFFPSGVNYMYMGLIKRGVTALAGFFLLLYLAITTPGALSTIFVFGLITCYLTCIFDGFNIRRRINAGEHVLDDNSEIVKNLLRNKPLMTVIAVILAVSMLGSLFNFAITLITNIVPLLIIILGVYLILKHRKKS